MSVNIIDIEILDDDKDIEYYMCPVCKHEGTDYIFYPCNECDQIYGHKNKYEPRIKKGDK